MIVDVIRADCLSLENISLSTSQTVYQQCRNNKEYEIDYELDRLFMNQALGYRLLPTFMNNAVE